MSSFDWLEDIVKERKVGDSSFESDDRLIKSMRPIFDKILAVIEAAKNTRLFHEDCCCKSGHCQPCFTRECELDEALIALQDAKDDL